MRVLISAYACEPNKGSEPGVGWNWALQAARFHEVWVLTRANNRVAIETELAGNPQSNLHFAYHDLPRWARFWKRGGRGVSLYYLLWQLSLIKKARLLHQKVNFDVGHHVTFVSFRFPTALAWTGIPYVWGPLGGGERFPKRFYRGLGFSGALRHLARDVSNWTASYDPLVRASGRRARLILVATSESALALPREVRDKALIKQAIGIVPQARLSREAIENTPRLRVLYTGNLLDWKGIHLAIEAIALAKLRGIDIRFTVVGNGPYRTRLEALVRRHRLDNHVIFKGGLPYREVQLLYCDHDVFLFPSMRDSGGFVILEAMDAGLPIICLDIGGPSLSVTDEVGRKVDCREPSQVVSDLAEALVEMSLTPELRHSMGVAGQERVKSQYDWDRLGSYLDQLYRSSGGRSAAPRLLPHC